MDRYVMRHDETHGLALVPESALDLSRGNGWVRVSEAIPEHEVAQVDVDAFAAAPDLDAGPPAEADDPTDAVAAAGEEKSSPEPDGGIQPVPAPAGKPMRGK